MNLWSVSRSINATTGVVSDETYTLAYSNVACRYEYTKNFSNPFQGVGRLKRPDELTTDNIHFIEDQQIGSDWCVVNISLKPDGTRSELFGECHRILGAPDYTPSAGLRRGNKFQVMAQSMEHPPAGVTIPT